MSVLSISELPAAEQAAMSNVVSLRSRTVGQVLAKRDAIRAQVDTGCESRRIYGIQAMQCMDIAMAFLATGGSPARCVEEAVKLMDRIVRERNCVRSRGRTDDLPPAA